MDSLTGLLGPGISLRIKIIRSFDRHAGSVGFGQPSRHLLFDRNVFGLVGQVGPFVWILLAIVKLFRAVAVADVAPSLCSQGVIAEFVGR